MSSVWYIKPLLWSSIWSDSVFMKIIIQYMKQVEGRCFNCEIAEDTCKMLPTMILGIWYEKCAYWGWPRNYFYLEEKIKVKKGLVHKNSYQWPWISLIKTTRSTILFWLFLLRACLYLRLMRQNRLFFSLHNTVSFGKNIIEVKLSYFKVHLCE